MLSKDIAYFIKSEGGIAHVVANGLGGVMAQFTAMHYPECIQTLTLTNAPHPALYAKAIWKPQQFVKSLYAMFHQLPILPEL